MNSVLAARHLLNSRNVRVRSSTIRVASIWSERMQSIEIAKPPCGSPTHNRAGSLRSWIGDRRVLAVAGLAVTGTGLSVGWDWLTAVGLAPLIVSVAPCLIMYALGVCMMGRNHQACSSRRAPGVYEPPTQTDPPVAS